jgi:hypothetical protein
MTMHTYKILRDTTHEERSWGEDSSHENGAYHCVCVDCGRGFTGHKRRVVCKVCAEETGSVPIPPPNPVNERILTLIDEIEKYVYCMSYNDSYFGERPGRLKQVLHELGRLAHTERQKNKSR